jgi:hypothetical protein
MKEHYAREELGQGVRGKFYNEFNEGHNLIMLKPEVAKYFSSEEAVNEALLSLIKIAQASINLTNKSN